MDLYYVSYDITIFSYKYGFEIFFCCYWNVLLIKIMVILKFKNYMSGVRLSLFGSLRIIYE